MLQSRRGFIRGLGLLLAAPAIIRVSSLMPVKVLPSESVLRMLTEYNPLDGQMIERLDILYGYLMVRPEWAVVVADVV